MDAPILQDFLRGKK